MSVSSCDEISTNGSSGGDGALLDDTLTAISTYL